VFSKIDLLWAYLQLELAEDRRYLTSFVTHEGVYRFRSLPFGLASGPLAFHQVVCKILQVQIMGLNNFWCFVFQKGGNVITDIAAFILLTVYKTFYC